MTVDKYACRGFLSVQQLQSVTLNLLDLTRQDIPTPFAQLLRYWPRFDRSAKECHSSSLQLEVEAYAVMRDAGVGVMGGCVAIIILVLSLAS